MVLGVYIEGCKRNLRRMSERVDLVNSVNKTNLNVAIQNVSDHCSSRQVMDVCRMFMILEMCSVV